MNKDPKIEENERSVKSAANQIQKDAHPTPFQQMPLPTFTKMACGKKGHSLTKVGTNKSMRRQHIEFAVNPNEFVPSPFLPIMHCALTARNILPIPLWHHCGISKDRACLIANCKDIL
jgi:hypothetical protein